MLPDILTVGFAGAVFWDRLVFIGAPAEVGVENEQGEVVCLGKL